VPSKVEHRALDDKVRAKASSVDLCFPGHDPGMLLNYPKVAEDVTRLA
jgi:hypothetical protein